MLRGYANVVVHVAELAAGADPSTVERALSGERGVVRARMSPRARSLAIVDYDPRLTSALAIRRSVEAQGFTARLVGM